MNELEQHQLDRVEQQRRFENLLRVVFGIDPLEFYVNIARYEND